MESRCLLLVVQRVQDSRDAPWRGLGMCTVHSYCPSWPRLACYADVAFEKLSSQIKVLQGFGSFPR